MRIIKNIVMTTALVISLDSAMVKADICLGMACMYNRMTPTQGIDATLVQINESLKAIQSRVNGGSADSKESSDEVIIENIKDALKLSKEINANDKVDRNRNRANGDLKKAREAVQAGDLNKASEELKVAEKRFKDLKGMIDLTLDDRESQQTHMLNRILGTEDKKAGARK